MPAADTSSPLTTCFSFQGWLKYGIFTAPVLSYNVIVTMDFGR